MANKAVLLNIGVFLADNNVRRNIATFLVNAQSAEAEVNQRDTNVLPNGGEYTYTSVPDNSLILIKTSKPLTAEVNQGSTTFTVVINSVMILSDTVTSIVFTNDGDDPAQLSITQI